MVVILLLYEHTYMIGQIKAFKIMTITIILY